MPYYRIYITEPDRGEVVFAETLGKAKSEALRSVYDDLGIPYTALRGRLCDKTPKVDFSYFKQYYDLDLKAGTLCKFDNDPGEVVGEDGPYLKVYMKEGYYKGKVITCHPISEMRYE